MVAAMTLGACADDARVAADRPPLGETPARPPVGSSRTASGAVTADTIKVGIVIIDYDAIKDFVDFTRGDQQATAQVFVD